MAKDNLIAELANEFITGQSGQVADIITFIESNWGFGLKLRPPQRVILKALYGLPLDESEEFPIYDSVKEKIIGRFTEKSFMKWLYETGRCNYPDTPSNKIKELVLVVGRRGGKCRSITDLIHTDVGIITFSELLQRKNAGEAISIITYDPVSFKRSQTKDFHIWENGNKECRTIETKHGYKETSSNNHPYLVWRKDEVAPKFVNSEDVQVGDHVAISRILDIFGVGSIGINKAKILGYLQGGGGITNEIGFTTADPNIARELHDLIECEFHSVELIKKTSSKYGFIISRKLKKSSDATGSRKNDVKEWLKELNLYGIKSKNKKVPECIMRGSREEISAFLSRLFSCDGSVEISKTIMLGRRLPKIRISYSSASEELIRQVKSLLIKFGIHSSYRKRFVKCSGKDFNSQGERFTAYELCIGNFEDIRVFNDTIGIFSKQDKLNQAIDIQRLCSESKSWKETMPIGAWTIIKNWINKQKGSKQTVADFYKTNSRLRFDQKATRDKYRRYCIGIGAEYQYNLCNSDIVWDEIKDIKMDGIHQTVDLCVENTHIIGGEIISHNSLLSSCIIGYELYKLVMLGDPAKHYHKPEQQTIQVCNVAPTDDQANIVYDATLTAIDHCPLLRNRIGNRTQNYFTLYTEADIKNGKNKASLLFTTGGCSSNSLRGPDNIIVCFDEMAFFISNEASKFSGSEIFTALTPSVKGFQGDGKIICISSPKAKYGKFYDMYVTGMTEKESPTLVFQMYTAMINPEMVTTEDLKTERRRNRNKFNAEFGAEFSDSLSAWIDDPNEFLACVKDINIKPSRGKADVRYYAGLDLGFKKDGSALCIVHDNEGIITLDYSKVWFSGSSDVWYQEDSIYATCNKYKGMDRLSMEDIADEIIAAHSKFPIVQGMMDQREGYGMLDILRLRNIKFFESIPSTTSLNSEIYDILKSLYADGLLCLYNDPVLVKELMMLEALEMDGMRYKCVVEAPARAGCHDDISEAFARAVYLCYNDKKRSSKRQQLSTGGMNRMGRYMQKLDNGYNNRRPLTTSGRRFY